jgi:hypothetical protein
MPLDAHRIRLFRSSMLRRDKALRRQSHWSHRTPRDTLAHAPVRGEAVDVADTLCLALMDR